MPRTIAGYEILRSNCVSYHYKNSFILAWNNKKVFHGWIKLYRISLPRSCSFLIQTVFILVTLKVLFRRLPLSSSSDFFMYNISIPISFQVDKIVTFHVQPVNEYPPDVNAVPEIRISEVGSSNVLLEYENIK